MPVRNCPSNASNCWVGTGEGTRDVLSDAGSVEVYYTLKLMVVKSLAHFSTLTNQIQEEGR